jgi:DNA-binding response OmpR family regulator
MRRRSPKEPVRTGLQLRRVLVVEDDPVLGMATEDTLREGGVEHVDICPTTDGALEVLKAQLPDAIILDVHLSDRDDGWAIAELVESLGENSPRIVFSTGAPQDIPPHIAELGSVLTKPYAPEALLAALREPGRRGLLSRLRGALG